ncbi:hypothetical protein DB347_07425 [Opitutaceae bacterium EW11]|nr:hypothetical protein DB347_07425 [Opitutaceae bacterium EW11]
MDNLSAELKEIRVELIDRNPENPRILFRQDELEELLNSIRVYGVQVPIAVYKAGRRYVLIDGERRWRCSKKLGRETVPALIQTAPDPLRNLLLMFNIHSLREQWDLLTIAMKLPRVVLLLSGELGREPKEHDICERTGLSRAVLRRCKLLIELPQQYKDQILEELHKPKAQQRLTEDFFIEMERSLKTVWGVFPQLLRNKDEVRRVLIKKYQGNVIKNVVHFRLLAKIARASKVEVDESVIISSLSEVLGDNHVDIERVYEERFSSAYNERDLVSRISTVLDALSRLVPDEVDDELRQELHKLVRQASQVLEDAG